MAFPSNCIDAVTVINARSYQRNRLRDFSSRSRGKPRHRKEKMEQQLSAQITLCESQTENTGDVDMDTEYAEKKETKATPAQESSSVRKKKRRALHPYCRMFLAGTMMYLLAVLPFIIYHGGIFFYYGDYNVQQVPFYILAHRAVRQGNFFWNAGVDLGSNMGGAFAFYLWGSPFFWLTIPFPEAWLPYMMPVLMALKFGTAMTTGYAWIRTQTKTESAAMLGAILYSFSGFQMCNIVFQHFHEVTAFFPLYLLVFDRFIQAMSEFAKSGNGAGLKREWRAAVVRAGISFALMTGFMSVLNYYFFVGEVIFLILYYILRFAMSQSPRQTLRQILHLLFYGVLGLCLAAFFLVQSLTGVFGNSRLSELTSGYDLICYPDSKTYFAILKALFMTPDLIAKGTLFTNDNIRVSSLAAYMPCMALTGVIAYFGTHRKDWKKRLLIVLAVMAFIPGLNAVFSAMNASYYARWYYLPILLMAAVSAQAMEENEDKGRCLRRGGLVTIAALAVLILCACLPVQQDDGSMEWFTVSDNPKILLVQFISTAITIPVLIYLIFIQKPDKKKGRATKRSIFLVGMCAVLCTMAVLYNGNTIIAWTGGVKWQQQMLQTKPELADTETFSRVETDSTSTNYEMVWGYPTIHCFESTVNPSIISFYNGIGIRRSVESNLPFSRIGARALLSVRYYIENILVSHDNAYSDKGGMSGYELVKSDTNGYDVYENYHYIPMGFTFDYYMTQENYDEMEKDDAADRLLVKDLILSQEDALAYGHLMQEDTNTEQEAMDLDTFYGYCDDRASSACSSFAFDKDGFSATAALDKENLVFFSVPYDKGWTAKVDGQETKIIRADYGLMAVCVPAGEHEIRFDYRPYGFRMACGISAAALALLVLLLAGNAYSSQNRSLKSTHKSLQ